MMARNFSRESFQSHKGDLNDHLRVLTDEIVAYVVTYRLLFISIPSDHSE